MLQQILQIPREIKFAALVLADSSLICLSMLASYQLAGVSLPVELLHLLVLFFFGVAVTIPILRWLGMYRSITRFFGLSTLTKLLKATLLASLLIGLISWTFTSFDRLFAWSVIYFGVSTAALAGIRLFLRWLIDTHHHGSSAPSDLRRYIIYGACDSGRELGRSMLESPGYDLVGYVDDDPRWSGRDILGVPVIPSERLPSFIVQYCVSDVLLAISNESRAKRNQLISMLQPLNVRIRALPKVSDLFSGKISLSDIHDFDIDDLLGRSSVSMDQHVVTSMICGEVILVTGAGGSIGSELCRQILELGPKVLILYDWNEYALYQIHEDLMKQMPKFADSLPSQKKGIKLLPRVIPLLGSVNDSDRLSQALKAWKPSVLYHAAAYKHVPLVENNIREGVLNNVFGTLSTALAAIEHDVRHFVLVSTDKAVRPTNIMGATKRIAEMCLQALAVEKAVDITLPDGHNGTKKVNTDFSIVRFGNVLGSSGSVVPLFKDQIYRNAPVTVTHPDVTRYFMSIKEAAQLVLQAGAQHLKSNDLNDFTAGVFVLDMGEPIKIVDLARRMIELHGFSVKDELNPDGDIEIKFIGLRAGEKLFEELLIGDNTMPTSHPLISKAAEPFLSWEVLNVHLNTIYRLVQEQELRQLRQVLSELVSGYAFDDKEVDLIFVENTYREKLQN